MHNHVTRNQTNLVHEKIKAWFLDCLSELAVLVVVLVV